MLQCLVQYTSLEIMSGSYNISCPDPQCQNNVRIIKKYLSLRKNICYLGCGECEPAVPAGGQGPGGEAQDVQTQHGGDDGHVTDLVPRPGLSHHLSRVSQPAGHTCHVSHVCDAVLQRMSGHVAPGAHVRGVRDPVGQHGVHQAMSDVSSPDRT